MTSRRRTRLTGKGRGKRRGRSPGSRVEETQTPRWLAGQLGDGRGLAPELGPQKVRVILASGASAEGKATVDRRHLNFSQFSPLVTHHWLD